MNSMKSRRFLQPFGVQSTAKQTGYQVLQTILFLNNILLFRRKRVMTRSSSVKC